MRPVPAASSRSPAARVAAAGCLPGGSFDRVAVRDPARLLARPAPAPGQPPRRGFWTILEETHPHALGEVARQVVVQGPAALRGVPRGQFGDLLTVDRHVIEAFRAIRELMEQYCRLDRADQPLSIAVFGPPGSGKSFGVTQVATSLLPGRIKKIEFNQSQLASPDDLPGSRGLLGPPATVRRRSGCCTVLLHASDLDAQVSTGQTPDCQLGNLTEPRPQRV